MSLNFRYTYQIGHWLFNGSIVWGHQYSFKAPPYPGEDSLQRVVIFGDMGKVRIPCQICKMLFLSFLLYISICHGTAMKLLAEGQFSISSPSASALMCFLVPWNFFLTETAGETPTVVNIFIG